MHVNIQNSKQLAVISYKDLYYFGLDREKNTRCDVLKSTLTVHKYDIGLSIQNVMSSISVAGIFSVLQFMCLCKLKPKLGNTKSDMRLLGEINLCIDVVSNSSLFYSVV